MFLKRCREAGYTVSILFVWLNRPEPGNGSGGCGGLGKVYLARSPMSNATHTDPELRAMQEAVRHGVAAALKRHRLLGETVAVLKDGRVQSVLVDELDLDEDGYPPRQNPEHAANGDGNSKGAH